jgi:hypothetical protein
MKRQPRTTIVALDKLIERVTARSLAEADWQLLTVLLKRLADGEDVLGMFYEHDAQKKGAVAKQAREAARRNAAMRAMERATFKLLESGQRVTLRKVAVATKLELDRVRDLTTKQKLVASVQGFRSYGGLLEWQATRMTTDD